MVLQWAAKQLFKYSLKSLNKYLSEEIDLEQLDVQLGSGTARLGDIRLNADYINEQVKHAPFIVKHGALHHVLVGLTGEIEIEGLDIVIAPRSFEKTGLRQEAASRTASSSYSGQNSSADAETAGSCTYLGVNDGIWRIVQIIWNLLLSLRVKVVNVTLRFEDNADGSVTLRLPRLSYGCEEKAASGDRASADSAVITKVVRFEHALVTIGTADGSQVENGFGVSGTVDVSTPEAGPFSTITLDCLVDNIRFGVTLPEIQQVLSVLSAFRNSKINATNGSIYHDSNSFYDSSLQPQNHERRTADSAGKQGLPVIVDWMRKPKPSEPDLAASMDEFFECLDAWSQSGSGSGLWSLTRSAFGATSVLDVSKEVQTDYKFNVKLPSVAVTLLLDSEDGVEIQLGGFDLKSRISALVTNIDLGIQTLELIHLSPSDSQRQHRMLLEKSSIPRFSVGLDSLRGNRGVQILRTARHLTAEVVSKHQESSGYTETDISISLQPVVLWLDSDFVSKLGQRFSQLRVPVSNDHTEAPAQAASSFKLKVTTPWVRTVLSAENCGKPILLAIDLVGGVVQQDAATAAEVHRAVFTVADGSIYLVRSQSAKKVVTIYGKASVDVRRRKVSRAGSWVTRRTWDSISPQKSWELGGKDSEFAAATKVPAETSSLTEDLKSTSPTSIEVQFTGLHLDFSSLENIAAFELLRLMLSSSNPDGPDAPEALSVPEASQTFISVTCAQVGILADLQAGSTEGTTEKYELLELKLSRLAVVFVGALGSQADASYLKIQHRDGEVLGLEPSGRCRYRLLLCKATAIGRGDGSGQNALASGTAGLTLAFIYRPASTRQPAESFFTGTLKGTTLLAFGGQFDWIPSVIRFVDLCMEPFNKPEGDNSRPQDSCRSSFLFDGHDIAVCYEPEDPSSNSVACVLAAAALRVSSNTVQASQTDQYDIWLKDLGLHLVDTVLRTSPLQHYTAKEMEQCHYIRVAKGPVVCASVKINEDATWELECAKSHIYIETCRDTTSSFGRLVADLQQIFAPDIQQDCADLHLRKGKSVADETFSPDDDGFQEVAFAHVTASEGLFEGVVENAFAIARKVEDGKCSAAMSEIKVPGDTSDSPVFIEDYYVSEHATYSTQECETPSTSYGQDFEAKGRWYGDSPLNVVDTHVDKVTSSSRSPKASVSDYPKALGRIVFSALNIQWRLYGGLDWGGQARQTDSCMEVSLRDMDLQYDGFGPTGLYASALVVEVEHLRVYDRSANAPWTLVLGYYDKLSRPRESTSKALKMRMDTVRPNPSGPREEYRVTLSLLPIALRLDQGHKDFLADFFSQPSSLDMDIPNSADGSVSPASSDSDDPLLPYFQMFEMRAFTIRVDYVPRRVDLEALTTGDMFELVNLVSWKGVELHLRTVFVKGRHGWGNLMKTLFSEWLEDVSNQRHKFAQGMGPIRPLCAVSAGAAKLVVFPAKQYKKDRRLLRGMRKGALAFLQSLSLEALGLGANLAAGAHHVLVQTELALGGASGRKDPRQRGQPSGTREGLQQAYESMAQGLEKSAISLVGNPVKVYQHGGSAGLALASAIRNSPSALLAPASATADAVRQALLGVRNSLDPECKRESRTIGNY